MGSYATLKFGHFTLADWKSHVPFEPMILFKHEDYIEELLEPNDEETSLSYKFVVSASTAMLCRGQIFD